MAQDRDTEIALLRQRLEFMEAKFDRYMERSDEKFKGLYVKFEQMVGRYVSKDEYRPGQERLWKLIHTLVGLSLAGSILWKTYGSGG